jgi:hypothetical protein
MRGSSSGWCEPSVVVLGPAEPGDVRGPESVLLGAVHHGDAIVASGDLVGEATGAVGAVVVDDEDARARHGAQRALDRIGQCVQFVVRRYDDESG